MFGDLLSLIADSECLGFLLPLFLVLSSSSELDSESDESEFEDVSEEEAPLSVVSVVPFFSEVVELSLFIEGVEIGTVAAVPKDLDVLENLEASFSERDCLEL